MKSKQNPPGVGKAGSFGVSFRHLGWSLSSSHPLCSMAQSIDPHPASSPLKAQIYLEIQNFVVFLEFILYIPY